MIFVGKVFNTFLNQLTVKYNKILIRQMGRGKANKEAAAITKPTQPQQKKKRIQKSQKNPKKATANPDDYRLIIKKTANQKQVIAEFPQIKISEGVYKHCFPIFRRDRLDYTPGFSLSDEFNQNFLNEQRALQEYRMNSQNTQIDVENIKQPKPSNRNSYCTICKIRFEDYKQHIQLKSHLQKMRNSYYNRLIDELCLKMQSQRQKNIMFDTQMKDRDETGNFSNSNQCEVFIDEKSEKNFSKFPLNSKQELYMELKKEIQNIELEELNLFDVIV